MKWVFIAALVLLVPMLTAALRANPRNLLYAAFAIGALPFFLEPHLFVAPISRAGLLGTVKGIEVSLLDGVVLAVLFSTRRAKIPMAVKLAFGLLVLAVAVSTAVAYQPTPALFYAWQLLRTVMLFVAVVRICRLVPNAPLAIIAGAGMGLIYESIYATIQFMGGDARPGGNLGHSNFLGLSASMVTFPAMAWALGGRRFLFPGAIVAAGLLIAIVGGSRATLGLFGFGAVITVFLSLRHRRTSRKMMLAGLSALLLLIALPAMVWALDRRSAQDKLSSNEERAAMKLAATMMITDHPLGIGANGYVLVANIGGYSARAGVPWGYGSRSAPVHSAYYLVAAELGILGLAAFVTLLTTFLVIGLKTLGKPWPEESSELVPGLVAAMIVVVIHIGFEWVFFHFVLHYLFAITTGLLVALAARAKAGATRRIPLPTPTGQPVLSQAG